MDLLENLIDQPPINRFVTLILFQAIQEKAEEIVFELNQELHEECQRQYEEFQKHGDPDKAESFSPSLPGAFAITFNTREKKHELPAARGTMFQPAMRILLNVAEIPYWTKTPVSGEIRTRNPATKWAIKSEDLAACVRLLRL